jgi:hypothetical protein
MIKGSTHRLVRRILLILFVILTGSLGDDSLYGCSEPFMSCLYAGDVGGIAREKKGFESGT